MKTKSDFLEYVLHDAMQGVRGITAKPMFGGYGLYKDGVVFGIIADDELYFKVDDANREEYKRRGSRPFTYEGKNHKMIALSYWEVPAEVQEDRAALTEWVDASAAVSRRNQAGQRPKLRCGWANSDPLMAAYHDEEWGVPCFDDRKQFEFLILESAQAGLSWMTVLKKRENYRRAFAGFDPEKVARFGPAKVKVLLKDPGIIRNRLKVAAAISNASAFLKIQKEFGSFSKYIWRFVGDKPVVNRWKTLKELPANTPLSDSLSADLKKRGFKFLGPTVMYSHLQALGLVNDHTTNCFRKKENKIVRPV